MPSNRIITLLMLASLTTLGTACHPTKSSGTAGFASITITNRMPDEIRRVTEQVFQADGYQAFTITPGEMVFEKEGGRMNQLAYGGLISTTEGDTRTWIRVKASIVDLGAGTRRLQCQAYVVPHRGDAFFEEEKRISSIRSGPYQELLNQVKARLAQ
ncbi:MAG TPA: hypothetical protein VNU68_27380 [Verrucomicrobiae bacterium]|nr:hypothetical protein [Verrucomicrobiae bacterium]